MKIKQLFFLFLNIPLLHGQWERLPTPPGTDIVNFLETSHDRLWAGTTENNYFSDDQGATWQSWVLPGSQKATRMWVSDTTLMAVSMAETETIFRSADNGNSWQAIFSDTLNTFQMNNVFSAGGHYFIVHSPSFGWGKFLFRSDDDGKTWNNINVQGNGNWENQLMGVEVGGAVLIARKVFQDDIGDAWFYDQKSTDFGQSWGGYGFQTGMSEPVAVVRGNGWVIKESLNSNNSPMFLSTNSGFSFTPLPANSCNYDFAFSAPGTLISYENYCISRWNSIGLVWEAIETPPVDVRKFIQADNGRMFIASYADGIWRYPASSSSTQTPGASLTSSILIYPNPAREKIEVRWPLDVPDGSLLCVYDSAGKRMLEHRKQLLQEQVSLNIAGWPAGLYVVSIGGKEARLVVR